MTVGELRDELMGVDSAAEVIINMAIYDEVYIGLVREVDVDAAAQGLVIIESK